MYAFAFERPAPSFPERDYLMETWEDAEQFCLEEWGVPLDGWDFHPIPDAIRSERGI